MSAGRPLIVEIRRREAEGRAGATVRPTPPDMLCSGCPAPLGLFPARARRRQGPQPVCRRKGLASGSPEPGTMLFAHIRRRALVRLGVLCAVSFLKTPLSVVLLRRRLGEDVVSPRARRQLAGHQKLQTGPQTLLCPWMRFLIQSSVVSFN